MSADSSHWIYALMLVVKLLAKFGLIPGFIAAFGVQKFRQKYRQKRAVEGWPSTEASIQWCKVHTDGPRSFWIEATYSYYVGEYYSGTYIRRFKKEEQADDLARQLKDKRIQVHYKTADPANSVILERDLEMVALLAPLSR